MHCLFVCIFVYLAYLYYLYSVLSVFCIICMATIWPTNLETVMEKRHALGGARTLGKLDESSTGACLSAQMRGRVLVFRLLSASSSRVAEVGQFVHVFSFLCHFSVCV